MSDPNDNDKTIVLGGASSAPATPQLQESSHNALPAGTRLGEFELIGLVGEGGFGIVYLAQDHSLERRVALKEYMPASLAARTANSTVSVRSERHRETFEIGRRSFVNEARLLAQFDHPALVKVYRFWEANGTAYMAMPYYEGRTLRDALKALGSAPDESWIRKVLAPVIDALELIHRENCFHRDVAPDNIMLLRDDRPVLLDFGAARRVIGDMTQALTVILKPGYAPIEQYAEMPGMQQGPWTDIYALAAMVYFMITGKTPPPAVGRMMQDSYQALAQQAAGRYSDTFLRGVDRCLSVKAEDRPQNMAQMRQALGWSLDSPLFEMPPPPPPTPMATAASASTVLRPATTAANPAPATVAVPGARLKPALLGLGGGAALLAIGAAYWLLREPAPAPPTLPAAAEPAAPVAPPVAPPVPVAPAPPPAAVVTAPPALPRPDHPTLSATIDAVMRAADPALAPLLEVPAAVVIGRDQLTLKLESRTSGHLYLLLWDTGDDRVYRLFPNDADPDNLIGIGNDFHIPRSHLRMPWTYPSQPPAGEWRVLALVSEHARDFEQSALRHEGDLFAASRGALENALAAGESIAALIGTPRCVAGEACSGRFGAAAVTIAESLPTPAPATRTAPQPPAAAAPRPPRPEPTPKATPKPPAAPAAPARSKPEAPAGDGTQAEREYMQQLNKDLDRLLQGR